MNLAFENDEEWYNNVAYDWDRKSNMIFVASINTFCVVASLLAYIFTGKLVALFFIPIGLLGLIVYFGRTFMFPVSVGISPRSLQLRYRFGRTMKTYHWQDIREIRFRDETGDPLTPHNWKNVRVYLSDYRKKLFGIHVSDEVFELIRSTSRKYNPEIILRRMPS